MLFHFEKSGKHVQTIRLEIGLTVYEMVRFSRPCSTKCLSIGDKLGADHIQETPIIFLFVSSGCKSCS